MKKESSHECWSVRLAQGCSTYFRPAAHHHSGNIGGCIGGGGSGEGGEPGGNGWSAGGLGGGGELGPGGGGDGLGGGGGGDGGGSGGGGGIDISLHVHGRWELSPATCMSGVHEGRHWANWFSLWKHLSSGFWQHRCSMQFVPTRAHESQWSGHSHSSVLRQCPQEYGRHCAYMDVGCL